MQQPSKLWVQVRVLVGAPFSCKKNQADQGLERITIKTSAYGAMVRILKFGLEGTGMVALKVVAEWVGQLYNPAPGERSSVGRARIVIPAVVGSIPIVPPHICLYSIE